MQQVFENLGIDDSDYEVSKVSSNNVPKYLKKANMGISFRSPIFSQIAVLPTKILEYLACGIPVIINSQVGDTTEQVESNKVGVVIENFTKNDYKNAKEKVIIVKRFNDWADKVH